MILLDKSQFSANSAFSSALPTFPYRPHLNVTMASTERDSTVIVPDNLDEVRARLEERRKKQLERAKQARADYEKRMEEEKAAAAKRAEEAKNAPKNKGDGTKEYPKPRTPGEKSPHQKQNGGGKGGSAPGVSAKIQGTNPAAAAPKASAIDANAKFLAAAAARAADIKDGKVPAPTIGAGNAQKPKGAVPAAPKSFETVMAEKKSQPAEPADPNLRTKTMTVKTEGDEELEIKYSVHVPEAAKKRLEERKRARDGTKGSPAPEEKAPAADESAPEPEEEKPKKKAKEAAAEKEDVPDFSGMKVVDLKKELVKRDLPVNGLKAELVERLIEASK